MSRRLDRNGEHGETRGGARGKGSGGAERGNVTAGARSRTR